MPDTLQMKHTAYLLTGSNMGNRLATLQQARERLAEAAGEINAVSAIYETASWGIEDLPAHLNQAIELHTTLTPVELLQVIQSIEQDLGRERIRKWGNRAIDIDIIYYDDIVLNSPSLTIPHPLMQQRNFVLEPLVEIAPHFKHPIYQQTNNYLLAHSTDNLAVAFYQGL